MGDEKQHPPVMLICGILAANQDMLHDALELLTDEWAKPISTSDPINFIYTDYYNKEMGTTILRMYCAFDVYIDPAEIFSIKRQTNQWEQFFLNDGMRQVNLDPGYVSLAKLVLATTKDASYRIYGGDGIFAETTLYYKAGSFTTFDWTYPDYRSEQAIAYFNTVRELYRQYLKDVK